MNLDKLIEDAKRARCTAEIVCAASDDGGSANLDATFLPLGKGQRAANVLSAIQAAGLFASPSQWLGRGIMIQPPGAGQAGKRYASNQALCKSLQSSGWDVLAYYQMD